MSDATRMQYCGASRARRLLAAITGLSLVAFGVLGVRHEARVAHYVDAHTGLAFHAPGMVGDHTGHRSDVHPCDGAPDDDACGISSTLHQAARPALEFVPIVSAPEAIPGSVVVAVRAIVASQLVYRLAPKTSPPVVA